MYNLLFKVNIQADLEYHRADVYPEYSGYTFSKMVIVSRFADAVIALILKPKMEKLSFVRYELLGNEQVLVDLSQRMHDTTIADAGGVDGADMSDDSVLTVSLVTSTPALFIPCASPLQYRADSVTSSIQEEQGEMEIGQDNDSAGASIVRSMSSPRVGSKAKGKRQVQPSPAPSVGMYFNSE